MTHYQWLQDRGISASTADAAGVKPGVVYFPDLGRKTRAIFFQYRQGWKARSYPDKAFVSGGNFKADFWGLEEVLAAGSNTVLIVEGELDRLSLIEAGLPPHQILAMPNASTGLDYVAAALSDGLGAAKRFVWCGDADEAGYRARDALIKIVGVSRFWHVTWPEGIKDANEMLVKDGAQALRDLVADGALPWPQDGLFRLSELPTPPELTIWTPTIPGFDGRIHLAPRTLSVVTGQPGHGKTMLFNQIWYEIAKTYGITCCIASFETGPKPHIRRQLRTLITGKLEIDQTDFEKAQADAWIESHYLFIQHTEQRPTLEWFLDCAETAVIRHDARVVQLDPWNRMEAMRLPRESESEYILRCLRALYVFAKDMNCHMQIVAHPAKMDGPRRNMAPTLEDISGCYSSDTEVLTRRGWLKHEEVTLEDEIACFDPAHEILQWDRPSKIWQYDYDGEMHHHKYRGGDLLVTPNHRMIVKHGSGSGAWEFKQSDDLFGDKWFVPQSAYWETCDAWNGLVPSVLDNGYDQESFWSYVGWWIAEGWVGSANGLHISQRENNSQQIKDIMDKMGLDFSYSVDVPKKGAKGTLPIWKARVSVKSHPDLTRWIVTHCGRGAANKRIPAEVFVLPVEYQLLVFDGLMAGDGHAHRAGWSYATISSGLADDVQRLAIQLGYTAQKRRLPDPVNPKHRVRYQVNINARARSSLHPYRNTKVILYKGKVWCLTVPTGAYITRRNGWASICGNSKHWENVVDQGFVIHRPHMFEGTVQKTETTLKHMKARYEELGYPCQIMLNYDLQQRKYVPLSTGLTGEDFD